MLRRNEDAFNCNNNQIIYGYALFLVLHFASNYSFFLGLFMSALYWMNNNDPYELNISAGTENKS